MKLGDKGPFAPPPKLPKAAERVAEVVRAWPEIICATHWYLYDRTVVDGVDFYVGERELGHLHLDGELHLSTSPALRDALVPPGLARLTSWDPSSAWVVASVRTLADVELGIWLFRLNYDRLQCTKTSALLQRVADRQGLRSKGATMH